jgi:amidophosphoribosyltransferase
MNQDMLVAFRDECGIRPLSLGRLEDGSYVAASETCALDTIGARHDREVLPGEMVIITSEGLESRQVVPGRQKIDVFEYVYFARPDSIILGKSVNDVRMNFGRQMAFECPIDADIVVPVPDSAIPAAQGYAEESGIPFEMNIIKNRYIHRTFIRPTAELREHDLKMKLNPLISAIKGKRVLLVDDSIVRGGTQNAVGLITPASTLLPGVSTQSRARPANLAMTLYPPTEITKIARAGDTTAQFCARITEAGAPR